MEHFNKLTPAELERLAKLAEEASEVVQIVMKIMRHGYESYNPDKPEDGNNRAQLERELIDFYKIASVMADKIDICSVAEPKKFYNVDLKYMHHQGPYE